MLKAAQAYFQTQVNTTSQGQLLVLLYDGAIKFLKQAKVKIDEKDYAQKGILISKAIDVIAELAGSLNVQKGGDLAENLHKLYFYCNTKLLQANMKMDTGLIDEVITILTSLRGAFAEVLASGIDAPDRPMAQQQNMHHRAAPQPGATSAQAAPAAAPPRKADKAYAASMLQTELAAPKTVQTEQPRETVQNEAAQNTATPDRTSNAAPPLQARRAAGTNLYRRIASQTTSG